MTSIALSAKATKLMKLCDAAGFACLDDLLAASITDSVCPAICMTEGCDYTTEKEPDQTEGYCEACGGNPSSRLSCSPASSDGAGPCSFATSTGAPGAAGNGPTCGRHNVTMIVRSAARGTSLRTRAKMPRRATMNKIALLNDAFRTSLTGGTVLLTVGVQELPDMVKAAAIRKVVDFDDFNEDNDPYGEHDFGSFELCNRRFFWKIDYYDERSEFGSEDPADPQKTTRILTIMLASEY